MAERLGVLIASVQTLTLGSHGDTMVPVPSRCTVDGKAAVRPARGGRDRGVGDPYPQWRRRGGGATEDRIRLLRPIGGGCQDGEGGGRDSGDVMPVCAWVDGEFGIAGVYLGVEAEIGREGVRRVVATDLQKLSWRVCWKPARPCAPSRATSRTSSPTGRVQLRAEPTSTQSTSKGQ